MFVRGHVLYTSGFAMFLFSIPVWAMSSMLDVSVRTCWWSMRMLPQHFFAKDRYLWSMLCLCCKLALPTTRKRELISFFMYHKCKPDSNGLNIIADTMLYEISSCSVSYLYFPDLHCQFWYFNIIFLFSFFLSYLIFYTSCENNSAL